MTKGLDVELCGFVVSYILDVGGEDEGDFTRFVEKTKEGVALALTLWSR